jgi:hypothetical protein
MAELESREMGMSDIYMKLKAWKDEDSWTSTEANQRAPRSSEREAVEMLIEQYKAYVYIKRAGVRYDYYRTNLHNNYNERIAMYPTTVVSANNIMDHHRNMQFNNNRTDKETKDTSKAQSYLQEQNTSNGPPTNFTFRTGITCFKCDREGHLTKDCWFDKKEDGSGLNSKESIDAQYQAKFSSMRKQKPDGGTTTGSTNLMDAEYVPTIDEYLDLHEYATDTLEEFAFIQYDSKAKHMNVDVSQLNAMFEVIRGTVRQLFYV